ncbi:hypothetical protein NECAME_02835 [Necator americanus]|uniref:Rhodanese domain-containing protein n=1 Tax=Necator americanus TaxID=51031 RepID=W2TCE5_NECAM|nr:hypothetical protein NECAME_02835 [Necator americanus]ETN78687.1 hypothetical protein NECAME_02835 [Necator americanus]
MNGTVRTLPRNKATTFVVDRIPEALKVRPKNTQSHSFTLGHLPGAVVVRNGGGSMSGDEPL